jgi:hypothetical protein
MPLREASIARCRGIYVAQLPPDFGPGKAAPPTVRCSNGCIALFIDGSRLSEEAEDIGRLGAAPLRR